MSRFSLLLTFLFAISQSSFAQSDAASAYTPSFTPCPEGLELVRTFNTSNITLNANEVSYVSTRRNQVLPEAWKTYAQSVQGLNISLPSYVTDILNSSNSSLPTLGLAGSGGGYRASFFTAAILNALDARNSSSVANGMGGLLQAASYISGVSGSALLITALAQANLPTIRELIFGPTNITNNTTSSGTSWGGLNLEYDYFEPSSNTTIDEIYLEGIIEEIAGKNKVGFPITFADMWARLLARHYLNGTDGSNILSDNDTIHGANILFSGLKNLPAFGNYLMPYPILASTSQYTAENKTDIELPGADFVPLTNIRYEFTLDEFGTYDPRLGAFVPMKYIGSTNSSICVTGFDNAGFIAGSSSMVFNEVNTSQAALSASPVSELFTLLEISIPQSLNVELDASLIPNPFYGLKQDTFVDSAQASLSLFDGGEDGLGIGFDSLLVTARGVDVVIAADAINDENGFTAGSTLISTQNRTVLLPNSTFFFPAVPTSLSTFISLNLSSQPSFFGCNESSPVPLLIYLANGASPAGLPPITNISTEATTFTPDFVDAFLDEVNLMAIRGRPTSNVSASNASIDPEWPACLACAVVDRSRLAQGINRSGVCVDCMKRYCVWENYLAIASNPSSGGARPKLQQPMALTVGIIWLTLLFLGLVQV